MNKIIASILIFILSPLFLLISVIIFISDGFPIFYKQKRFGQNKKTFELLKFRTMYVNAPLLSTEDFKDTKQYLIPLGSFIRKWSLDELPQFFNIINGNINFIGPRPSLVKNEEDLNKLRNEMGIFRIKPGITGWAQVNGRDSNSYEKKTQLDYYYIQNQSLKLDLKIILLTIYVIFSRKGVKH